MALHESLNCVSLFSFFPRTLVTLGKQVFQTIVFGYQWKNALRYLETRWGKEANFARLRTHRLQRLFALNLEGEEYLGWNFPIVGQSKSHIVCHLSIE